MQMFAIKNRLYSIHMRIPRMGELVPYGYRKTIEVSKIVASAWSREKIARNLKLLEHCGVVSIFFSPFFCWLDETQLGDPRYKK